MNLYPTFRFGDVDLTDYPFSVEFGADRGSAQATIAAVASALRDGSFSRITRYENRTITIPILVEGPSLGELALHEATLVAEVLKQQNEFTFHPGDDFSVASVYDTLAAQLTPSYDDELEQHLLRRFTLTFEASPHPRSVDKVVTPAVTGSAPVVLDNGSAPTGWAIAYHPDAVMSVVSGAVTSTYDPDATASYGTGFNRTFASPVDTSASKYVGVDWKASIASFHAFRELGGVNLTEVRREPLAGGFTRSWYQLADSVTSLSGFHFGIVHPANAAASATLSVDQVLLANALPNSGTARQKIATVVPGGSVPAEGTVVVEHPTAGLGQTIVFSHPVGGGYTPPLRQWKTAGATDSPDPALVSGAFTALAPTIQFSVPWDAAPHGDTQLWARMYTTFTGLVRISWAAYTAFPGFALPVGDSMSGATDVSFTAGEWAMVPLGRFVSPPTELGSAGRLRIDIAGTADIMLDEAWLFAMDQGVLTVVDNGTGAGALGGAANRLRVSAPSVSEPRGSILAGYSADWSDSHAPNADRVACDQRNHRFDPKAGSFIFAATSGATDASVSLEHYPRWHSNAGA